MTTDSSPHDLPDEFGFGHDDAWFTRLRRVLGPDQLGQLGRYKIRGEAHRGGQGIVYRAHNPDTGEEIALKRLSAGRFSSEEAIVRFEREVTLATELDHPGIVRVYRMEILDDQPVIAMEWFSGVPITQWANAEGNRRETVAIVRTMVRVCEAVHHAHQRGVLHRDLKPSNILVDPPGTAKIVDFGVAKPLHEIYPTLTASDEFVGTVAYAAPEQLRGGSRAVDVRADVYSTGVILYELLAGRHPFDTSTGLADAVAAIERGNPRAPSQIVSGLDRELDTIVTKALNADPAQRYQSMDGLAEDLRRHLRGDPILAHPPSTWYQVRKLAHRHRFALAASTVAFVTVLGLGALSLTQSARAAEASARELEALDQATKTAAFIHELFRDLNPWETGERASVLGLVERATRRIDEHMGEHLPSRAELRITLGTLLTQLGHTALSEVVLREAVDLLGRAKASEVTIARAKMPLAAALQSSDLEAAHRLLLESHATLSRSPAQHVRALAAAERALAELTLTKAEFDLAKGYAASALQRLASTTTDVGHDRLTTRAVYGRVQRVCDELDESATTLAQVVDEARIAYGTSHPAVARALRELAVTRMDLQDYGTADADLAASHDTFSAVLRPDHPEIGKTLLLRAACARQQQDLELSLLLIEQAEATDLPPAALASAQYGRALIHLIRGETDRGEELLRSALATARHSAPRVIPETVLRLVRIVWSKMVNTLKTRGDSAPLRSEARALLDEALAIESERRNPTMIDLCLYRADIEGSAGEMRTAESWTERALEMHGEIHGEDHKDAVHIYIQLSTMRCFAAKMDAKGSRPDYSSAIAAARDAVALADRTHEANGEWCIKSRLALATALQDNGETAASREFAEDALVRIGDSRAFENQACRANLDLARLDIVDGNIDAAERRLESLANHPESADVGVNFMRRQASKMLKELGTAADPQIKR